MKKLRPYENCVHWEAHVAAGPDRYPKQCHHCQFLSNCHSFIPAPIPVQEREPEPRPTPPRRRRFRAAPIQIGEGYNEHLRNTEDDIHRARDEIQQIIRESDRRIAQAEEEFQTRIAQRDREFLDSILPEPVFDEPEPTPEPEPKKESSRIPREPGHRHLDL